jgi:hypothetical protein
VTEDVAGLMGPAPCAVLLTQASSDARYSAFPLMAGL